MYMMASISRVLYVGMTNNLARRVEEHKEGLIEGFTKKYNVKKLICFETFNRPRDAIVREKEVKGWLRAKKIELIEWVNPSWRDLAWGDPPVSDCSFRSQ